MVDGARGVGVLRGEDSTVQDLESQLKSVVDQHGPWDGDVDQAAGRRPHARARGRSPPEAHPSGLRRHRRQASVAVSRSRPRVPRRSLRHRVRASRRRGGRHRRARGQCGEVRFRQARAEAHRATFFRTTCATYPARIGVFDIVICSGLLYHLPRTTPIVCCKRCSRLARASCRRHLRRPGDREAVEVFGTPRHGHVYGEHDPNRPQTNAREAVGVARQRVELLVTEPSLMNMLAAIGFTSCSTFSRRRCPATGGPQDLRCDQGPARSRAHLGRNGSTGRRRDPGGSEPADGPVPGLARRRLHRRETDVAAGDQGRHQAGPSRRACPAAGPDAGVPARPRQAREEIALSPHAPGRVEIAARSGAASPTQREATGSAVSATSAVGAVSSAMPVASLTAASSRSRRSVPARRACSFGEAARESTLARAASRAGSARCNSARKRGRASGCSRWMKSIRPSRTAGSAGRSSGPTRPS